MFDGGVPELKKKTIQARKSRNDDLVNKQLDRLNTFVKDKHQINIDLRSTNLKSTKLRGFNDDKLFYLDDNLDFNELDNENEIYEDELERDDFILNSILNSKDEELDNKVLNAYKNQNYSNIDTNSDDFLRLAPEIRHEILTEIKESKKFNRTERIHKAPDDMNDYSIYQIDKLVNSRNIQKQIEKTREEMFCPLGVSSDLKFKEEYEKYISTRIASDDCTQLVFGKKKVKEEEQPKLVKSIEKPKNFSTNIYGTIADFDYDLTSELDPESKSCLINERLKKKFEIKKEVEQDNSSTDDSDFIAVPDELEELSTDNKDFNLANIHPALLLNENNLIENQQSAKKDESLESQVCWSPKKRSSDKIMSSVESSGLKKRTNLLTSFTEIKNKSLNDTFDVTISLDETVDESKQQVNKEDDLDKDEQILNSINKSEIPSIFQDDLFDETLFKNDLNNFLDNIESQKATVDKNDDKSKEIDQIKPSTSKGLSIDFLENEDNEIINLVDKSIIDKITESPMKSKESSQNSKSTSQNKTPEKAIKMIQLKPPTDDQLANNNKITKKPSKVDLSESLKLVRDIQKVKRQTNTVADSIVEETKDLLSLFGIPYVVSPMEAEAQCAILEQLNLVKGIITEDSDVWLFGAKTVYKNFYNQSKFVIKYTLKEIQTKLKLTRENLICLAMLTGSDYTDGIKGVGPVTATEIINEFNGENLEPLINFKQWLNDNKNGKPRKHNKIRNKFLKYELPKSFPSQRVFDAYMQPEVDHSTEKFQFGKPDLDLLRRYTREKFCWSKEKQDKELLPLFKRINDNTTQSKIQNFFPVVAKSKNDPYKVDSKRLQKALDTKITILDESKIVILKKQTVEDEPKKKNASKTKKGAKKETKKSNEKMENKSTADQNSNTLKNKVKNQRKKRETNNKVPNIFDKQIKISEYFQKKPKPVNVMSKLDDVDEDVICLSEDSD